METGVKSSCKIYNINVAEYPLIYNVSRFSIVVKITAKNKCKLEKQKERTETNRWEEFQKTDGEKRVICTHGPLKDG